VADFKRERKNVKWFCGVGGIRTLVQTRN